MDALDSVLNHFSLSAGVFYTGNLCGSHSFAEDPQRGHLHVIRRGRVTITTPSPSVPSALQVTEPSLIFFPGSAAHLLVADEAHGADVMCGTVLFGGGGRNPITASLPELLMVRLADIPGAQTVLDLVFDEAFKDAPGKHAMLDRLCQILIIQMLRHCLFHQVAVGGTLAGLADPRLAKTLQAMHDAPQLSWSLDEMARAAHMSRARFAERFKSVTGETPANYLVTWRLMAAQNMLKQGLPLKRVALDVGYGSTSALARAFLRELGLSPMAWLKSMAPGAAEHHAQP